MHTAPFKRPPTLFRVTRHPVLKNQGYTKTPASAMLESLFDHVHPMPLWTEQGVGSNDRQFHRVDQSHWLIPVKPTRIFVLRSKSLEVHISLEGDGLLLSVLIHDEPCRELGKESGGLRWAELQGVKSAVGLGGYFALEVYPADEHADGREDARHLWVHPVMPSFAWFGPEGGGPVGGA